MFSEGSARRARPDVRDEHPIPLEDSAMTTPTMAEKGRMVVARFLDGKVLKGTIHDFAPNKEELHLYKGGDERSPAVTVRTESLKALFFVKDFVGNKQHQTDNSFESATGQGRKIRVRFLDGEEMAGFTMGYSPQKQGFFMIPADADCNNARVYVFKSAVVGVEWV
jgi:hypothetical protein